MVVIHALFNKDFYNYDHYIRLHVYSTILQIIIQQMKKYWYRYIYIHTLLCTQVSNKRLDTILLSNDKSGMSTGVKIEKNANKLLLVSAFSSENIIGK